MNTMFLVAAVLIGIRGYTFARWLGVNGNRLGMFGVFFIIMINLSLAIYRMINTG
ncbi:MAG: hypothetical protein H6Q68_4010 [Firmicutes bacterium]|nr:hypothetical protein [Bacillota bacterium]